MAHIILRRKIKISHIMSQYCAILVMLEKTRYQMTKQPNTTIDRSIGIVFKKKKTG